MSTAKPAGSPKSAPKTAEERLQDASAWWSTSIIDIQPGQIGVRGYAIQDLIGRVRFPDMVWLMLRGELPTPAQSALLEAAMVAAVDHGPHAPSIAISRMAVTCGLPLNGAMASAINALDDVHGGAGEQCMTLLQDIDTAARAGNSGGEATPDQIEAGVDRYIAAHGKIIPGFGHRWHGVDPRAVRLLQLVREAQARGEVGGRFGRIAEGVERVLQARKGAPIPMNIDGATAVIYSELGFAAPLGRGLFILSRSVGILAHAWEQTQQGGRIKGPMSPGIPYRYTGVEARALPDDAPDHPEP
ncbi:citryl-CoA lyase [Rhizobacter fulvus]|jgi:citrate synthase